MKGLNIDVNEGNIDETGETNKCLILSKRNKTKLVLHAESEAEFEGWHQTLLERAEKAKSGSSYENVKIESKTEISLDKSAENSHISKMPIPTPRTNNLNTEAEKERSELKADCEGTLEQTKTNGSDKTSEDTSNQQPPSKKNSIFLDKYNHLRINKVNIFLFIAFFSCAAIL